jgi:hypothetical protein
VFGMLSLESLKLGIEHVEMKQKDTGEDTEPWSRFQQAS